MRTTKTQPVHLCSLISAIVVRCLDSIPPILAKSGISRRYLVSVAEQDGLSLARSETLKIGFLMTRLNGDDNKKKSYMGM